MSYNLLKIITQAYYAQQALAQAAHLTQVAHLDHYMIQ